MPDDLSSAHRRLVRSDPGRLRCPPHLRSLRRPQRRLPYLQPLPKHGRVRPITEDGGEHPPANAPVRRPRSHGRGPRSQAALAPQSSCLCPRVRTVDMGSRCRAARFQESRERVHRRQARSGPAESACPPSISDGDRVSPTSREDRQTRRECRAATTQLRVRLACLRPPRGSPRLASEAPSWTVGDRRSASRSRLVSRAQRSSRRSAHAESRRRRAALRSHGARAYPYAVTF